MTDARKVYDAIMERIIESWHKVEDGNLNDAYVLAFKIGLIEDIKAALKKVKR